MTIHRRTISFALVTCWVLTGADVPAGRADVVAAEIFTDHMVLQRHLPVRVWGRAAPGEKVRVRLLVQQLETEADDQGHWRVKLAPLQAGGPHEMTIEGKNPITLKDILVGEVWVCSGQSNMAFSYGTSLSPEAKKARKAPASNQVCFYNLSGGALKKADKVSWVGCDFDSAQGFSAVGVYFGRELYKELKVPVGLINAFWGVRRCRCFTRPWWTPSGTFVPLKAG